MTKQLDAIAGFSVVSAPDDAQWSWPVYRGGSGPAVVILHELYGLSKEDIALAVRIRDAGFTVWLPVLIGPAPAKTHWDAAQAFAQFCISREIVKLRIARTSPVVTPLRALARYALAQSGGTGVGVIGMCMSGGFALGTAVDDVVLAAVAAEPALPFASPITPWCAKDPGVSADDLTTVRSRLTRGDVEVFLTRFACDRWSPTPRFVALEAALGSTGVTTDQIPSGPGSTPAIPKKSHAVLSLEPSLRSRHRAAGPVGYHISSGGGPASATVVTSDPRRDRFTDRPGVSASSADGTNTKFYITNSGIWPLRVVRGCLRTATARATGNYLRRSNLPENQKTLNPAQRRRLTVDRHTALHRCEQAATPVLRDEGLMKLPFTPYAGVAAIFRYALESGLPPKMLEDGKQMRDFVHVHDVARANLLAIDLAAQPPPGRTEVLACNVASWNPRTVVELAAELATAMGGPAPLVMGGDRPGDVRHVVADAALATERLGFSASVPFTEGVTDFATAPMRAPVSR